MTQSLKNPLGRILILLLATHASAVIAAGQAAESPKNLRISKAPASGALKVAFVISEGATVIDIAGPWDVFESVMLTSDLKPNRDVHNMNMIMPFSLYIVAETKEPVTVSSGMKIVPDYTFLNAPKPHIIVIPAQTSRTPAFAAWLKKSSKETDVVMSVCTGAYVLAHFGMLDGLSATTHSWHETDFKAKFPKVGFKSGVRYVENRTIATAGGETSGIDLALRVVARYFGEEIAQSTADFMMYRGNWKNPNSSNPE